MKDYTRQAAAQLDLAASRALTIIAMQIAGEAKKNTVKVFRTKTQGGASVGTLRASINHDLVKKGMDGMAKVGAGGAAKKYAAIQEFGGTITAKNPSGYLSFPVGDGYARVRSVTLPPRPYLRPAAMKHGGKLQTTFAREMEKATGGLL